MKERGYLEDLGVEGTTLTGWGVKVCTEFNWLRIRFSGELF
jgi:hypothetical protein